MIIKKTATETSPYRIASYKGLTSIKRLPRILFYKRLLLIKAPLLKGKECKK